jgi:hypothetical protein
LSRNLRLISFENKDRSNLSIAEAQFSCSLNPYTLWPLWTR